MNILFVIDRLELKYFEFNDLVTNFWLIKEYLKMGDKVFITTIDKLYIKSSKAFFHGYSTFLKQENIFYNKNVELSCEIEICDLVLFRPDPPVDLDYINATYVFDFVDRTKVKIINDTKSIRNFNEKLHAIKYNELMPENIVTSSSGDILKFLEIHKEIILKPLNNCFGAGVMYLKEQDKNTAVIINSMTNNGKNLIMVQKYLKSAQNGDKRVLILGNKVYDWCVRKLPSNNDFKFCEHNDKNIIGEKLTQNEKNNFSKLAIDLNKQGIYMAGLDVVDEKILEINITSPCYFIREINNHFNINFEKIITEDILKL